MFVPEKIQSAFILFFPVNDISANSLWCRSISHFSCHDTNWLGIPQLAFSWGLVVIVIAAYWGPSWVLAEYIRPHLLDLEGSQIWLGSRMSRKKEAKYDCREFATDDGQSPRLHWIVESPGIYIEICIIDLWNCKSYRREQITRKFLFI